MHLNTPVVLPGLIGRSPQSEATFSKYLIEPESWKREVTGAHGIQELRLRAQRSGKDTQTSTDLVPKHDQVLLSKDAAALCKVIHHVHVHDLLSLTRVADLGPNPLDVPLTTCLIFVCRSR